MKDIRKELGDAAAISLGFIVIEITVFLAIVPIMRAIYCPPEERSEEPSRGGSRGIPAHLIANPVHKWHPANVYHR